LACHYRIALNDKRTGFGVPEVKLGLLPGAGGTQRLLKNLSLTDALDLLLTGKEIKARKAKAMGLVDILVDSNGEDLRSIAVQKAKYVCNQNPTDLIFSLESLLYDDLQSDRLD
jgi:enoyl-CoA hydratase/long-chain 3-hydroxyacyl-CoA dehydrogenase